MPGVILFLGALCAAAFFELEGKPASSAEFFKFRRIRSSRVFMLLIALMAIFAGGEVYLYGKGELYQSGVSFSGFLKLFFLTLALTILYFINKKSAVIGPRNTATRTAIGVSVFLIAIVSLTGFF